VNPMELTPKVFDDVEFRERFRGYDPDEVDAFLEQVARSAQELDQKLKDALERAEKAEARAREAGDADEALRRTLVLAQRTADAAVSEAETRAAALMAEAEGKAAATQSDADRQATSARGEAEAYAMRTRQQADDHAAAAVSAAEAKVAEMIESAERDAREGAEDLRQRLRTEVSALEALRERLRTDAGRLEAHIAIQRQRVLASVEALQRLTTDPDALREAPVPEFKAVDSVPTAEAMGGGGTPPAPPAPPPPVHAIDEPDNGDAAEDEDLEVADVSPADDDAEQTEADEQPADVTTGESVENADQAFSEEEEITGEFPAIVIEELESAESVPNGDTKTVGAKAAVDTKTVDTKTVDATAGQATLDWADGDGPATMQVPAAELLDDDDPYIAELRRAIVDPSPLGPRDDFEPDAAMADFYGRELEDSRWKGFRRRR
jgi:DivIVA domain-containing protein